RIEFLSLEKIDIQAARDSFAFRVAVIPTAVKRARAFFSARVGQRDLVVPQPLDPARFTARSLAPIRTLKKARPHDGARDDGMFVGEISSKPPPKPPPPPVTQN